MDASTPAAMVDSIMAPHSREATAVKTRDCLVSILCSAQTNVDSG